MRIGVPESELLPSGVPLGESGVPLTGVAGGRDESTLPALPAAETQITVFDVAVPKEDDAGSGEGGVGTAALIPVIKATPSS